MKSANVWAREQVIAGNHVRQLLVPEGDLAVCDGDGELSVQNCYGNWPASRSQGNDQDGPLTAILPTVQTARVRITWRGSTALIDPARVRESFQNAIGLPNPEDPGALRRPQVGALYSTLGHWASGVVEPGIVVMPTGTGKTETMLALFVAARLERLLVLVPTDALRAQISQKFESLGILQREGIVQPFAMRPVVGRLEHGLKEVEDAQAFAAACNVVVATPASIDACTLDTRDALLATFTHLIVDEAHHAPAQSWARIIESFSPRPVLLFTATPFREDGQPLPGRRIFRFPLGEAQKDGYFTHIDYRAVLSLEGNDNALADLALERLEQDLAAGHDHVLMARAKSIARASELHKLYVAKAPELKPVLLHNRMRTSQRTASLKDLEDRTTRVVVCVDMLGEGFDMPQLKVAAIHDSKKSLGPMVQLIGRFTRTAADEGVGTASVFVSRDPSLAMSPLRELIREDADWNLILRDITERVTQSAEVRSHFEESFSGTPDEVPIALLSPKMSARAHLAPTRSWQPQQALALYSEDQIVGGTMAHGASGEIAWFVVRHNEEVAWADLPNMPQQTYELIVMYFDRHRRLLYIYGSDNRGSYKELAETVLGDGAEAVRGYQTFRVLAQVARLIPTNVGLLDTHDHFSRFSMHVGSDVVEAISSVDRQTKTQTHIAASGFENGERCTISASMSGTFWSMRTAASLLQWKEWCDEQGSKLLDDSIDLNSIEAGFIIPEDLTERPECVLLALEWPWQIVGSLASPPTVQYGERSFALLDIDFEVDDFGTNGPFRFSLVGPQWRIRYEASFESTGLKYTALDPDATVVNRRGSQPLADWINSHKPTLFLDGDRMITDEDRLLRPRYDLPPYDPTKLCKLDWDGVDISVESQGPERRADSIQAFMSRYLRIDNDFEVLIDDDRAGEAADLVGFSIAGDELHVTLVHCKYSSEPTAGARVADLYELCGQAIRGAKWRQHGCLPLLTHLSRRCHQYAERTGVSPFDLGSIHDLYRIREVAPQLRPRFHTVLAQPGLSMSKVGTEQLRLISGAESYVRAVTHGTFRVYCSE